MSDPATVLHGKDLPLDGLLFDKDGTLFDFHKSWSDWTAEFLIEQAQASGAALGDLAQAAGFDMAARQFLPNSPIIAGTAREAAECLALAMPSPDIDALERFLSVAAADVPQVPAVHLDPFLAGLGAQGLALGVMTNDSEYAAHAHLAAAGITAHFDFVAGYDSGYGAKPAPDPLLAFAAKMGLAPARVAMVGDSLHDLMAGRAAGMRTVGVLTGLASAAELAPFADVVLPHIGHIPEWMAGP
ncbi:MAG: HAD family hydrolase [Paracoccaceae bacterium]